jgi:hypothetical protein
MIVRTSSVFCDVNGPRCAGWVAETTDGADAARAMARAAGWRRTGGRDVCPRCRFRKPVCASCGAAVGYYGRHGWAHTVSSMSCPLWGLLVTPVEGTDG